MRQALGEKLVCLSPEQAALPKSNFVSLFVQDSGKNYCFHVPKDTTILKIKTLAFLRKAQRILTVFPTTVSDLASRFALQRTSGAHLRDENTLGYYNIQNNQTLVLSGKGLGGADGDAEDDAEDEDEDEAIKQGLAVLKLLKNACEMTGLQDVMRKQLNESYNQAHSQLKAVYRERGRDPDAGDAAVARFVPIAIQEAPNGLDWVEPFPDDEEDDEDDDDDEEATGSQADSQAPTAPVALESELWRRAKLHPGADPRIKKPGVQWIPDHILEQCYKESDKNPNGKGNDYTLCGTDKERLMGARMIDHSLSGLKDPKYETLLREIGIKFFCGSKQPDVIRPNDDGSVTRPLSCMLHSKPVACEHTVVQNVIKGDPQGGKTREAVLDCWAKYFIHACLPIYYVRNLGGLNDCSEVIKDFVSFAEEIRAFCAQLKRNDPARFSWLNDTEIGKVILTPKLMSDSKANYDKQRVGLEVEPVELNQISPDWAEEAEQDGSGYSHWAWRLARPQVIVGLMNKAAVTKFMHSGCVVKQGQEPIDLDGAKYMVNRGELTKVFTGSKRDGKMYPAKITPFSLFFGINNVPVTFQQHGKKATAASSGSHPGRAMLHSAYGPCCWDTSKVYDQFENCKRGRLARLVDELDTITSEKKNHVIGDLTHDSDEITRMANEALDAHKFKLAQKAKKDARDASSARGGCESELYKALEDLAKLRNGETLTETDDARRERANSAREARRARRAAGAAAAGPSSSNQPGDGDMDVDDDDDLFQEDEEEYLDDDDDDASHASLCSSASALERAQAERLAKRLEAQERKVVALQERLAELEESDEKFASAEAKAMRKCSGHIKGMAGAAMYNVGITATIFGCMHRIKGGKVQMQTRLEKMPTPDAYNTLAKWDVEAEEYRLLGDPSKTAKKGSIKIKEAPVKRLGFFDMASAVNKNRFFEQWMLDHGRATRDGEGKVVPNEPVQPANARGSYTIRPCWYEHDEKRGERPEFPWVAEMMDEFLKAKKLQTRRMHNSWERNGEMFTMSFEELQGQREPLKKVRRAAQALIISGETRFVTMKDHLIADLFVRNGNAPGELMHEVCAYNYAGERLSLYFRPENLDERLIENIIDNPDSLLPALREYLSGDPTMHYQYKDTKTGALKNKLCDTWLRSHYIYPIRDELQRCVQREPLSAARLAAWETARQAAKDLGQDEPPRPQGRIKFVEETKVAKDAVTDEEIGRVQLTRIDFQKPTPQPRLMADLFTLIDAHRYHEDPEGMLPMPFVGLTKTCGGRAQRYMCHGHRSRIQVMVHTFDIFPNKRLGLAMCDAIQEGFRAAGYDEYERFGTNDSGCEGEWMEDWVEQVYVSTKDFVPLVQNALMSMEEWCRLLHKEQTDPQRSEPEMLERCPTRTTGAESDSEYAARLKESPSQTLTRVIGSEVVQCFRKAVQVWAEDGRVPTCEDMPYTEYPHLHKWLISHVNRAPSTKLRFLRHSNQNGNEEALRDQVMMMCEGYLNAEIDAHRLGEDTGWGGVSRFEQEVERLDAAVDQACLTPEMQEEHAKLAFKTFYGKIPLPRYSAAHAPGGDLETRDRVEAEHYHEALRELLAGRDTIAEQYERLNGAGFAFNHAKTRREAREAKLLAGAQRMRVEEVDTDGGPAKYLHYRPGTITAWLKEVDEGIVRSRKRNLLAINGDFHVEKGEATDEVRLTEFMERAVAALNDRNVISIVEASVAQKPPAAFLAKATTQGNLDRTQQRVEEVLNLETGRKALTLVEQLPSAECEWPIMVDLFRQAFAGTVKDGSKKADSIGTAFKWVAVGLGLTDFPQGDPRRFNLRRFVEELDTPAIQAAEATVAADANAQTRINNRRAARDARNAAAIAAVAEDGEAAAAAPRRVRARVAADGPEDSDEDME